MTQTLLGSYEVSSSLVAVFLSLILEGFYVALFVLTIWVLHQRKVSMRSPSVLLITIVFICNLVEAVVVFITAYQAFVSFGEGPEIYYALFNTKQIHNVWYAVDDFCLTLAAFCADILMCYRMYIVWSRDRRTLYLPYITFPLGAIGSLTLVVFDAMGPKGMPHYTPVSESLSIMTIIMTWYFTGLICYRLWSMERQKRALDALNELALEASDGLYVRICRALVESGLLYSLTQGAFLVCYLAGSAPGMIIIAYLNIRVIGIVTALIMLQLHGAFRTQALTVENPNAGVDAIGDRPRMSTAYTIPVFRVVGSTGTAGTTGTVRTANQDASDEEENTSGNDADSSKSKSELGDSADRNS